MKKAILFLAWAGSLAWTAQPAGADDSIVPGGGFPASRYETLWTKSPFAVATAEAAPESPDYSLVGVTQLDGTSYASLIERQNQDHFLVSSEKPTRGLTLISITRGHDGSDTYAIVQKDGQPITLKLEQAPASPATAAVPGMSLPTIPSPMPGLMTPQITMPGANFPSAGSTRPMIRFHRPQINLPPRPDQREAVPSPASSNQPNQSVQVHTPPPPAQ